jgi:microcystin-dependent protein
MSNSALAGITIIEFPAGMIMPYAGTSTPAGWLECNGAEIDVSAYPTLAAALGTTWNNAKNPLTGATYGNPAAGKFRLPDLRGSFLRGSSGGANNAQGVATGLAEFQGNKTAKNGLTATAASSSVSATLNSSSVSGTTNIGHSHGGTGVSGSVGGSDGDHSHRVWTNGPTTDRLNWNAPYGGQGGWGLAVGAGANNGQYNIYASGGAMDGFDPRHGHGYSLTAGGQSLGTSNISLASGSAAAQTLSSGTAAAQAVTVNAGDAETRPDAVGVRYLIKI